MIRLRFFMKRLCVVLEELFFLGVILFSGSYCKYMIFHNDDFGLVMYPS